MEKIFGLVEKFTRPLARLSGNKYVRAIQGSVGATPLIIVGSIFLIISNLEYTFTPFGLGWIFAPLSKLAPFFSVISSATFSLLAIYFAFIIGCALAKENRLPEVNGGLISLLLFIILSTQIVTINEIVDSNGQLSSTLSGIFLSGGAKIGDTVTTLNFNLFGSAGIFTAIIAALISGAIYDLCMRKEIIIKLPDSVPPAVLNAFRLVIPALFVAIIGVVAVFIFYQFDTSVNNAIQTLFSPLKNFASSYIGVMIILLVVHLLWIVGIHGTNLVGAIVEPIWLALLAENAAAAAAGQPIPNLAPQGFLCYAYIGGTGATLMLCYLARRSKVPNIKAIGGASFAAGLFNINEPIMFGLPVIYNPYLAIPYILAPMVGFSIAYFATKIGFVSPVIANAPWTMPAPIAVFLETGDWKSILISLINVVVSFVIYYPFFKLFEKKEAEKLEMSPINTEE